jgi:tetratricopeptide (TPR) repeat protein
MKTVTPGTTKGENAPSPTVERITRFLTRYRKPILISVGIVAVATVVLVIVLSVQTARNEAALVAVENYQDQFEAWQTQDEDAQAAQYDALAASAAEVVREDPRTYAAVRARILDARALAAIGRYDEASSRFVEAAEARPRSYLAPVAFMDAAVTAEEAGNTDRALELYRRIVDRYAGESAEVPRALFSIGRVHEQRDEIAEAAEAYRRLVAAHPESGWTNLARNRIIALTVQGRIGG